MKKIGRLMNIAMGIALSFCLSLTGMLTSPAKFEGVEFFLNFLISTVISIIIGFLVPLRPITEKVCGNIPRGSFKRRCVEALIPDIIFSPVMTLAMVALAYYNNHKMGGQMPFLPAFIKSLIISLIVGYILSFILMPLFLKRLLQEQGIGMPPQGTPENRPPKE